LLSFDAPATTEIYTLSLHDALPIFTIAVVGSGGDGVVTLGDLIAQVAAHEGLNVIKTEAYGPQIRGGESSCTVRVASSKIHSQRSEEHTSELQSRRDLVCRLLLEKK